MKTQEDIESRGEIKMYDAATIPTGKMYETHLSVLYSSEILIRQAITALSVKAANQSLQAEIRNRINRSQPNLKAIVQVFTLLGEAPKTTISAGLKSMIRELSKSIRCHRCNDADLLQKSLLLRLNHSKS